MDRQSLGIIPEQKTIHYKMDDYYETETNKSEKPSYQIYDTDYSEQDKLTTKNKFNHQINKFVDDQKGKSEIPKPIITNLDPKSNQILKFNNINKSDRVLGSINNF